MVSRSGDTSSRQAPRQTNSTCPLCQLPALKLTLFMKVRVQLAVFRAAIKTCSSKASIRHAMLIFLIKECYSLNTMWWTV